jgi:hypothetical protein
MELPIGRHRNSAAVSIRMQPADALWRTTKLEIKQL